MTSTHIPLSFLSPRPLSLFSYRIEEARAALPPLQDRVKELEVKQTEFDAKEKSWIAAKDFLTVSEREFTFFPFFISSTISYLRIFLKSLNF
jgi:hypothetical protein